MSRLWARYWAMPIDGVLRVLASDLDPETIRPKRVYRPNRYFARNELSRLCLGVLRTATEPLSTDDIAGRIIAAKGLGTADAALRAAVRDQAGCNRSNGLPAVPFILLYFCARAVVLSMSDNWLYWKLGVTVTGNCRSITERPQDAANVFATMVLNENYNFPQGAS